ncbi:ArsR/SmtB family transcription factor [Fimbriiglobus ruber]|uniref:HTH arsR-type domain-containing protein n=1 Tax=Fimbriiglobus ruber TaxID=1908690 RepID=A0A225DHF8_9BACT|nr:metalloregulator ArsR/SmtB family transcription factor [Fimbriiglobus ruber]OWK40882.1 hypothetical protein FRUB_04774 [Fimbriiglobus ruber]
MLERVGLNLLPGYGSTPWTVVRNAFYVPQDSREMIDYDNAKACADLLQALAEPTRLRIIELLLTGKKNVTELARDLNTEIVNVSHHLSVLRHAGLVSNEKHGRQVEYSLHPEYFPDDDAASMDFGWCRVDILAPE